MGRRAITAEDLYRLRTVSDPQVSPDGSRVAFTVSIPDREQDRTTSQLWMAPTEGGEPTRFTFADGDSTPRWSPDGRHLAFLRADDEHRPQVWVLATDGGDARQLTDTAVAVVGFTWSPDSSRLAYSAVALPDGAGPGDPRPIVARTLPCKMDGRGWIGDARVHLFALPLHGGDAERLTDGDFDVNGPVWSPTGDRIGFLAGLDPAHPVLQDVCAVPVHGGDVRRLTDWNGMAQAMDWAPDGGTIVLAGQAEWASHRHTRVFRLDAGGGEPKLLAGDLDRNVMIGAPGYPGARPEVTADGQAVRFCVRERGCVHVYLAPLDGGAPTRLLGDDQRSVSGVTASADGRRLAYLVNDAGTPGDVFTASADGGDERRVTALNQHLLDEVEAFAGRPRDFDTPGGQVHGWVIGPDDAERRPLLLDIHGGPHNAWGPGFDSAHLYHQVLAARGWRILLLNTPGSDGYGQDFYAALRGGWGRADLPSFLAPVQQLVDEGLADPSRLAVTGYSYGGYMTNWIVTQTDRFAAAISGGSIANLVSAYGSMDIGALLFSHELGAELHADAERYRDLSPLTHADGVSTPTLILHGQRDDRCPVEQAEEWFTGLVRRGKASTELVVYPDSSHLFILTGRPSHRVDYTERVVAWAARHAGAEPADGGAS